jgi:hypothetical protein
MRREKGEADACRRRKREELLRVSANLLLFQQIPGTNSPFLVALLGFQARLSALRN